MYRKEVKIQLPEGLHARPASDFVKKAASYQSQVTIEKGDKKANAKSMMSILSLGAVYHDSIVLIGEGSDEEEAVESLALLLERA